MWCKVSCLRKQHDGRDWASNNWPSDLKSNALTTTSLRRHVKNEIKAIFNWKTNKRTHCHWQPIFSQIVERKPCQMPVSQFLEDKSLRKIDKQKFVSEINVRAITANTKGTARWDKNSQSSKGPITCDLLARLAGLARCTEMTAQLGITWEEPARLRPNLEDDYIEEHESSVFILANPLFWRIISGYVALWSDKPLCVM